VDHQINNIHDLNQTELSEMIPKVCNILPVLIVNTVIVTSHPQYTYTTMCPDFGAYFFILFSVI